MAKNKKLDALIDRYYARLAEFGEQYVLHEGAVSEAFQTLLADAARQHHWTLIPQLTDKQVGKHIRPDGTLKDIFGLPRGHWEAKDTKDDLTSEVAKKTKKGYPLDNIIFEDTREAILIQNKQQVMRVDLKDREQIAHLFEAFFNYITPAYENFEKAVAEFKDRVPDIAKHLKKYIEDAHHGNAKTGAQRVLPNKRFNDAFAAFMEVCRTALNPNITEAQVDDMLVQHLLTERLIREIFDNPEFTRRNVIASEIEKVIDALTCRSFDRNDFLKSLDRFYRAIEETARTITQWSEKQGFLNTVYERFFQGYSVKLADTMGIVYTPQPIVDFMCASVVEVLEREFGRSLGDPGVNILDPCTGTGNFIVNLLRRIPKKDLPRVYREQLFANEIMLLPYYIAALNIEHAYYEQTGEYEPFEGLCFVDTLDLAESPQAEMSFMTAKNSERVERQKRTPITVIVGNPPYNANQANENDENKNRTYPVIDKRIRETYVQASSAQKTKLYDPYVRFFRWATDRLQNRDGVVCFVTNNSFVHERGYDGLLKVLPREFTQIYHLDLKGNVRFNPKLSGTAYNVFGIQVGVGITLAIKRSAHKARRVFFEEVPLSLRRVEKLALLAKYSSVKAVPWREIDEKNHEQWITNAQREVFDSFPSMGNKGTKSMLSNPTGAIFHKYSLGVSTNRDGVVYDFSRDALTTRIGTFVEAYNAQVDKYRRASSAERSKFKFDSSVKWSRNLKRHLANEKHLEFAPARIRPAFVRPFTTSMLYFSAIAADELGLIESFKPSADTENRIICCTNHPQSPFIVQLTAKTPDAAVGGRGGQTFPMYVYDHDGSNQRENVTDWSLNEFRTHYKDKKITKWDIFHYVYGLLHHPGYREKFADNLKRELPRIPYAPDFRAFAKAGKELAELHLEYEKLKPWKLKWIETPGEPLSYVVEKMKLSKDKTSLVVNKSLTLGDIPPETSEYRLGNRSALEWVIDQYQIDPDQRSGIVSDPNRDDDPEYIVRLVGQVVRVSVETVKIVKGLPAEFA